MPSWKNISNWDIAENCSGPDSGLNVEKRLTDLEQAYAAGNVLALFEACEYCDANEIQLPSWIPQEAFALLAAALTDGLSHRRGRAMSPLARLRENLKHYERWETVMSLVEHRQNGWKEYQEALRSPGLNPKDQARLTAQAPFDPGNNLEETFIAASEFLQNSFPHGSPDTIRKSYQYIERLSKDQERSSMLTALSDRTYERFGVAPRKPSRARASTFSMSISSLMPPTRPQPHMIAGVSTW